MLKALPSFTLLVDGLSLRRAAFDEPDSLKFVEVEVELGEVFMCVFLLPNINIIPLKLHPHISFICHPCSSLSN